MSDTNHTSNTNEIEEKKRFSEVGRLMGCFRSSKLPFTKFDIEGSFKNFTKTELLESIKNCHEDNRLILKRQLILIYNQRMQDVTPLIEYDTTNEIKKYKDREESYCGTYTDATNEIRFCLKTGLLFYYIELVSYRKNWEYDFLDAKQFDSLVKNFRKVYYKRVASRFPDDYGGIPSEHISFIRYQSRSIFSGDPIAVFRKCKITTEIVTYVFKFQEKDVCRFIQKHFTEENIDGFLPFIKRCDDDHLKIFFDGLLPEQRELFYDTLDSLPSSSLMTLPNGNVVRLYDECGKKKLIDYFILIFKMICSKMRVDKPVESETLETLNYIFVNRFSSMKLLETIEDDILSFEVLDFYLKYIIPVNKSCKERLFCMLCEMGNLENAKLVYSYGGIEHDCHGWYAMIKSLENGHTNIAEWLMTIYPYDLTVNDFMLYKNVAFYGVCESFEWLLRYNSNIIERNIESIKRRCRDGENKGRMCYQVSKFCYNEPSTLFGENERNHRKLIVNIGKFFTKKNGTFPDEENAKSLLVILVLVCFILYFIIL